MQTSPRACAQRPPSMAAAEEVSTLGVARPQPQFCGPAGPGPTAPLPSGLLRDRGQGAAPAGHPRGHLLRGHGQRHRPAPSPAAAGGGGRGRRRLPVSGGSAGAGGAGCRSRWAVAVGAAPLSPPGAGRYSYSCTEGENRQLWSSGHHLKSCRDVAFSQDGQSECRGCGVAPGDAGAGATDVGLQSSSPCPRIRPSMS